MQAVNRALGLAEPLGDLARREAGDVTQDEHLALIDREPMECLA